MVKRVATRAKVRFAREQRRQPTRMEEWLWEQLREGRLGPRFRRQHPLGEFVLDFLCPEARVAVEVDGPEHAKRRGYDQWRDERLRAQGILTLRFAESQVRSRPHEVLEAIREECARRRAAASP